MTLSCDVAIIGGASGAYNTLKKIEDLLVALQADVDQNESDSDSADSAATTDRGAIRTEFAAADTALVGGASAQGNTMKKLLRELAIILCLPIITKNVGGPCFKRKAFSNL